MTADVSEYAVNRKLGTIPPGLLVSSSQHNTRRIGWERGACLFLKRWGAYPERWCSGSWSSSCSVPRHVMGYLSMLKSGAWRGLSRLSPHYSSVLLLQSSEPS